MCACGHGMPWHTPKTRKRRCELCDCTAYEHDRSCVGMTGAEIDALARGERLEVTHARTESRRLQAPV